MRKCLLLIGLLLFGAIKSFPGDINKGYERIQLDYKTGKIDFENQLLQKFYYGFNKSKLAPPYIDNDFTPIKCGTELVMEYYNHKSELSQNSLDEIGKYLNSPFQKTSTSAIYITLSGKFQINYDVTGVNAVPTADNNGNGIPDYVELIGSYFDYVWHFEIDTLGYLPPPIGAGQYQISFENMDFYGYTEPTTGQLTKIVLHNNFLGFPANTDPEGNQKGAAKVTAAHEFKHATQLVYNNWNEPSWFLEMDATWMEDIAYNQVNDYYNYLPASQIVNPGRSFDRGQGYEDCIWMHYLSQKFGVIINRQIWDRRKISSELIYINFNNILGLYSSSFIQGFKEYLTWNYASGSNTSPLIKSYKEATNYPSPTICRSKSIPDSSLGCGNTELSANYFSYSSNDQDKLAKFSYYISPSTDQSLELIILYKNNTEEIRDTSTTASGILNYLLPKKLNDISTIIAIPIITSMNSGTFSNSIKAAAVNTSEFAFVPLKDIETSSPRIVNISVISESNLAITDSLKIFYKAGNSNYTYLKMNPTGISNQYNATIPGFSQGTNVYYYFRIYDTFGNCTFLPETAPQSIFTYYIGTDTIPPVIVHKPIIQKTNFFPFHLFAEINDNTEIDSVYLEYNLNGGNFTKKSMTNYRDSIYYVSINPDSTIVNSILNLSYRIIAVDNSSQHNKKAYPTSGYQQIKVIPGYKFISANNKIISDGAPFGIKDTITIKDNITIGDIKIIFHAAHGRFSDLSAKITPPFSSSAGYLFKNPGLGTVFENTVDPRIILEGDAYLTMKNFESIDTGSVTGEYKPDTLNLNNFNNYNAQGNWILTVTDNRTGITGNLLDWGLVIIPSETQDIRMDTKVPDKFSLEQNYPNPFNPTTRIRYSIPFGSNVELEIYDILGRERAIVLNEYKQAGNYEVEFSTAGKGFSSGIYFYKLTSGNFSSVKKLILLK